MGRRVFLAGQAVSLLGDGLALLAVPLLILQLTRSPVIAALAAAPRSVGYLVTGLPAGPIVDRSDPWRVLIAADLVRAGIFVALFALTGAPAWLILVLACCAGGGSVFFDAAVTVVVRDLFGGVALVRANTLLETARQVAVVLGPAAVGVLALTLGIRVALLIDAATFLVSLATLLAVRRPAPVVEPAPWRRMGAEFREGWRYVRRTPLIRWMTVLQVVVNLALAAEYLVVYLARDTLRMPAEQVSLAVVGGGLGGVAGAFSTGWLVRRVGPVRLIVMCITLAGVALAAIGAARDAWSLGITFGVVEWGVIVASIVNRTLRQQIVPRELLGRVAGLVRALFLAVTPVGAMLGGLLTHVGGDDPRPVFAGAGLLIVVAVPVGWRAALRHHRHLVLSG
jgi:MFS family permease